MQSVKQLWKLLKGNKVLYLSAVVATAIATALSLVTPLLIKYAVDTILGGSPSTMQIKLNLSVCALAVIGISILQGICAFFKGKWSAIASERIAKNLKDSLYDHIQKLPYDYHVKAQTGDLIQRCTSDVETVRKFLATQVIEMGRILFMVGFSIFFMVSLNVQLTLISLIIMPFIIVSSIVFSIKIGKAFLKVDEKEGELATVLQENLSGVRVVRAFGRNEYEINKFEEKNNEFRVLVRNMITFMAYFWAFSDFLCLSQIGVVLGSGVYMVYHDIITVGTLLVFTTYVGMLIWPMRNLGRILGDMSKMNVSLERINEVLNTKEEEDEATILPETLKGEIIFKDVYFGYSDGDDVLKGLSFHVKKGETIAILGTTGSGKSSIMHLMLRLYDYNRGSITINGIELKDIPKKVLREKIGIVLQEPFLYSKTIKENIKMAKNNVKEMEIFHATKTAAVHDVIEQFEYGYDTMVGEKGVTLSGGQKQRVAIARTLIKNAEILIFDDSLSAVDTETDMQIRGALNERKNEITTFIISQRITTLMNADRVFVLEDGQLTATGTHDQLVNQEGLYQRIWHIQNMQEESE